MALTTNHPSYRHSPDELVEKSKRFWNEIFLEHMNAEKEVLFPSLVRFPEEYHHEMKILTDLFVELSNLFSEIAALSKGDHEMKNKLIRFSELIVHHVRYEERQLFPKIQAHLSEAEFDRIGSGLAIKLPPVCRTPRK
jgi:hemerythrin-like domain-containing protein